MIIDNQRTIIKLKLRKLFYAIAASIIIIILLTTNIIKTEYLGLTKGNWAIIAGALYVLYYIYQSFLDPYYIYFSDEGEKIILRYYQSSSFNSTKNAIEIPKNQLYKFDIQKKIINQKEILILFQNTPKGIFKYPPVCISALNSNEKEILKETLKKYLQKTK